MMVLLTVLVCLSALLPTSISTAILDSKPKPVELKYSCVAVIPEEQQDIKHDDVPIILLHGLTDNKKTWHGVFEVLSLETEKEVCIVDLRNHGESPWNDKEYDVVAMTEDIKHLIELLNAPKAIVVGHSLGGKIAIHLALNYPELVEKIVVEDMRPNGLTPESLKDLQEFTKDAIEMEKYIPQGVTEMKAKEEFLKFLKEHFKKMNKTYELDDPSLLPIKCSDGKCQWTFNLVLLEAILRNLKDVLNESSGRFDGPALFIYGTKSNLKVRDDESNIKKLFPNAKLVAVKGAGHTVHTSKEFTTEVIKFVNNQ